MTRSKLALCACLLVPAGVSACNRTNADEQQRAAEAQRRADDEIAKSRAEADRRAAEAQRAADERAAKAREQADETQARSQANANDTIRSASEATLKARGDLREWAQKKLDSIDQDVDRAKTKAQTALPRAKADFAAALSDVESKRKTVVDDLSQVESRSGAELDRMKERLEQEIEALRNSVSHLKDKLSS